MLFTWLHKVLTRYLNWCGNVKGEKGIGKVGIGQIIHGLKGMWYLRKVVSSCKQFGPVSTCLCPKYIKFCFKNLRNDREDENRRR